MDREKVVKGFELCLKTIEEPDCRKECPYYEACQKYEGRVIFQPLMRDALAMLKEQQEQIEQMNFIYGFVYGGQVKEIKKLVRCNECRHRDPEDHKCDCGHDIQWQLPRADDWFCADGEEK